nr:MAG TPA: hypothetical protein [Caudoviricetes sp.]DAQ90452.1 MAG TPA: hypothetical protein [Caudoviricetes sp.]
MFLKYILLVLEEQNGICNYQLDRREKIKN